ncbi:MAG: DUF1858 domain-containing protein [Deltaproteobacteria bacterium]|nr:DUF1858 domain-containing protein [Deltaproteobacteria bacterium]
MEINAETKVLELIKEYPYLESFLKNYSEKFAVISNPVVKQTMGRIATLKMASEIAGIDINKFIGDIKNEVARHKNEAADSQDKNKRQIELKNIIKDLHNGVPRDIHIRYFAVRDKNGRYMGTLEVSQDITEIKKLSKEKRLLEWE